VEDLAAAPEEEVLKMWAGLGYYSRARNLQKAAQQVVELGGFPRSHDGLRGLAGIGEYTAGAVASIAFGLAHAAVDGNVRRVVMRLAGDAGVVVDEEAERLLDTRHPGDWNQAMMELGATVCLPRATICETCPVQRWCGAFRLGLQSELPPPKTKAKVERKERVLAVVRKEGEILLVPSPRVAGFWDLPEPYEGMTLGASLGKFRHGITTSLYSFEVREAVVCHTPDYARWWAEKDLYQIPVGTASKKALSCLKKL
jgi:A/G-specific adenine glycosylase